MDFMPVGKSERRVFEITLCCRALCVSTIGLAPVTVTVSSNAPTFRSAFTVAVNPAVNTIPSRLNALNPANVNVTV